jgi:class 3 adenylate cyclase/tetratricopeptide (TPR) repeat protein
MGSLHAGETASMTRCGACGGAAAPDAIFCHRCGHRLDAGHVPPRPAVEHRRERKWVTILFADLRHSLRLVAQVDPEQAEEILTEAIDAMRAAVDSYGGVVNKVTGDGIMALFGAPIGAEDHAVRGCGAALTMIDRLRQPAVHGDRAAAPVELRVGLNTGEVIVHPTAEYGAVVYDATGAAVHVASRMEQCAGPNEAYIAEETLRSAMGAVEVRDAGLVAGKDGDEPMRAYRLLGVSPRRPPRRRRDGGLTVFVNRKTELRILNVLREQAEGGTGTVVRLTGEAGCGKSRLTEEFVTALPAGQWAVHRCQASERHRRTGYRAIADMLGDLAGIDFTASVRRGRSDLERALAGLPADTSIEDRQALAAVAGLSDGDAGWEALAPHERRLRIEGAILRLLLNLSRDRPTLFVIEDAHWLDKESTAEFARFFDAVKGRRVLALVTARAGGDGEAFDIPSSVECQIQPLARNDATTMLNGLLRRGRGVAELQERLLDLTQGNPLFIEECLYSLADTGVVTHDGQAYALTQPVRELHVPSSVRGLLSSRIDRISDQDKDVLQAASVIGLEVPRSLLCDAAGLDEATVRQSLDRLCRDGFLVARIDPTQLAFRHGLTREAVYESIPMRRRAAMHARLLELIERWDGDHAELLAHHAIHANALEKAAGYCRRSGNKAFQRDAKEQAVRFFRQGLEVVNGWPEGPRKDCALFDLHVDLRNPLFQLARIDELAEHMAAAGRSAANLHDPSRLGRYYPYLSHLAWFRGDSREALEAARLTAGIAASRGDAALRMRSKFQEGLIWLSQSRSRKAVRAFSDVLVHLESSAGDDQYGLNASLAVTALSYISRAHADSGDAAGAGNTAEQALATARELKNPFASAFAYVAVGYHHLRVGRWSEATPWLRGAFDVSDSEDAPLMMPVAAGFLAWALVDGGLTEQGVALAERAVRKADEIGFRVFQPIRLGIWAHALIAAGQLDDARQRAAEAVSLARRQNEFGAEAIALKELGRALLLQARTDDVTQQAMATLGEARKLARKFGLKPLAREIDGLMQDASVSP